MDNLLKDVEFEWVKENGEVRVCDYAQQGLSQLLLAGAYSQLQNCDVEDVFTEEDTLHIEGVKLKNDPYLQWKRDFELLFKHAAETSFVPLTDEEITNDQPWRKSYLEDIIVYDSNVRVDLRLSPEREYGNEEGKMNMKLYSCSELRED
jgi:uncharacterized protein (DUF2225 family)